MLKKDNITSTKKIAEDNKLNENLIRPQKLLDYIGQQNIKNQLTIYIKAAKQRNESLDHILFYGPPGLGKTTLANIIAVEMNSNLKVTSGPVLTKPGELAAILSNLSENDVLFIDEIHRLNPAVEEILYSAMEDFRIDIPLGEGTATRVVKINIPKFTLAGATTRIGLISSPLRDRFGIINHLNFYTVNELIQIIKRTGIILGISLTELGAEEIAKRSRGTPRIANRLLRRIRDFAQVAGINQIDNQTANESLQKLGVDENGLNNLDNLFLEALVVKFIGGPVGLNNLAVSIGEEKDTLEDTIEPFLIKEGYIFISQRGRVATNKAKKLFDVLNNLDL